MQTVLYAISPHRGVQRPKSGSISVLERDWQRLYKAVVIAIWLLAIWQAGRKIHGQGNYYSSLGVPHSADQKTVEKLRNTGHCADNSPRAKKYHPDKVGAEHQQLATKHYLELQNVLNVIGDPDLRRVYDNHGPSAIDCSEVDCSVDHNYISQVFSRRQLFYLACVARTAILVFTGKWGLALYLSMPVAALATLEGYLSLELPPSLEETAPPAVVDSFLKMTGLSQAYVTFELVALLRAAIKAGFMAFIQLRMMMTRRDIAKPEGESFTVYRCREHLTDASQQLRTANGAPSVRGSSVIRIRKPNSLSPLLATLLCGSLVTRTGFGKTVRSSFKCFNLV
ncbi:hypothetical protein CERZMDRAFT_89395 [Cercospora zeae-maydis SCOH1-5]|uniref:J domain-containing protein n=1 Tax=Cercospora zeae-maydis SCOH1-5 TaxID=717836 RepID=A0A6A6F1Z4_9PEZI|nr:hypothetical protein CERZMDRAFT_89395 [Cercospora zeae-maydis SCOH1-5]